MPGNDDPVNAGRERGAQPALVAGAVIGALLALLGGWSYCVITRVDEQGSGRMYWDPPGPDKQPPVVRASTGYDGEDATGSPEDEGEVPEDVSLQELLRLPILVKGRGARYDRSSLREVLRRRTAVSVLNFWAEWCGPCRAELPEFKKLAEEQRWGEDIRFVPVLTDSRDAKAADKFRAEMPVVDIDLQSYGGESFSQALRAAGVIGAQQHPNLPITVVIDCWNRLTWFRAGAVTGPALIEMRRAIEEAREENKRCVRSRIRPRRSPEDLDSTMEPDLGGEDPSRAPYCGDGHCKHSENCHNCLVDCRCEGSCTLRKEGGWACVANSEEIVR